MRAAERSVAVRPAPARRVTMRVADVEDDLIGVGFRPRGPRVPAVRDQAEA